MSMNCQTTVAKTVLIHLDIHCPGLWQESCDTSPFAGSTSLHQVNQWRDLRCLCHQYSGIFFCSCWILLIHLAGCHNLCPLTLELSAASRTPVQPWAHRICGEKLGHSRRPETGGRWICIDMYSIHMEIHGIYMEYNAYSQRDSLSHYIHKLGIMYWVMWYYNVWVI